MAGPALPQTPPTGGAVDAAAARLAAAAGALAALSLLAMIGVIGYEVVARSVFNAPTSWVVEVGAYLLVALAFVGLAPAERAGAHIHVDLLLNTLPERMRRSWVQVADWIGLLFVLLCAWQLVLFNLGEYLNDTRSWGLLSTPQWLPQLPMTLGFMAYALAMLGSCLRQAGTPRARADALRWALPLVLLVMVLLLVAAGRFPQPLWGSRFDAGILCITLSLLLLAALAGGWRIALAAAAVLAALAALFLWAQASGLLATALVLVAAVLGLMLMGLRISLALGLAAALGLVLLLPRTQLSTLAERAWTSVNSFTLTAVPMFVMMSALLLRSGVSHRMFDAMVTWFGRTPGGLAHSCAAASTVFAAVSGSSIATAATLGKVACPEMIGRGYSRRLSFGITAAGATLGILIPPSIPLILYGSTVGAPIDKLFLAGIVPGLLLALLMMVLALGWVLLLPGAAPRGSRYTLAEKLRSSVNVLPFVAVIGAVLGSLYAGIATPTEAGAMGVLMSLLLCLAFRAFSWRMLAEVAQETVQVTTFILLIVVCASSLSWVFDYLRLPRAMVDLVREAQLAPWMVIAAIAAVYLVLGMFVESISMILMTIPVAYPVVIALGYDPVWFGIFLVLMVELGLITPPVGLVLFVLKGVNPDASLKEIALGALPFVGLLLGFVALLVACPGIVGWLPGQIK